MFVFNWLLVQKNILKNYFKQNIKVFLFRDIWHTLIILFGLALLYIFLNAMLHFIDRKGMSSFDFAFTLLSFSLLVFLPLLFYSAIVCSLSFLFQKEDLHFYFSLPINSVSIFSVKFIQTYFHTNWMVFLGFLSFLLAIQNYFKTTFLIYITGGISFLLFLLIPVCLAIILVILISRFIPFVRSKSMLVVIGLLSGSILVSAIRVMQPERLVTAEGKMRLATFVQNLHKPWMTILPSEWVTNILFAQTQRDYSAVMVNFLSLLTAGLILLTLVYFLAKGFYKSVWANSVVTSVLVNKRFGWQIILRFFPASLRGFIRKDLISFYRDTIEKGSLLILIPLVFVYLYSIFLLKRHIQNAHEEQVFSFLYIYLFNFFYASVVISGLSGRWVFPSISLEGNNFKLIKKSPVQLKDFLKAKFLLGFIPLLLLGELLILASSFILHLQFFFVLVSCLTIAALCYGLTLICLILGMKYADFSIITPLDFALSPRGFLCLVWELIFIIIGIILVAAPTVLFLYRGASISSILCLTISLLVSIIIINVLQHALRISLRGLSRREV